MANKVEKVGVAVSDLSASQLNLLIIGQLENNIENFDGSVFFCNVTHPLKEPRFACYQIAEMYNYDGVSIATDLQTANKLLFMLSPPEKYFYVWELEWFKFPHRNYHDFAQIYRNPELKLIARTEDYANMIEHCFNRKVDFLHPVL